jgi:cytochrome c peroxidase
MYVVLSGTNQIALIDRVGVRELRAKVGVRPVDVAYDAKTRRVFVVNALDDSISVVDSTDPRSVKRIQLGPELELTAVDRGERLFFDARLSLDGWMSCHSCHTNGHSAHRLADTMGDGLFGNPKRIPSLLGTSQSGPWAWNGSKKRLTDQLKESLTDTMHGPNSSPQTVSDLSSYLASLTVPQSINESRGDVSESRWASGKELFKNRGCVECHAGPLYTSRETFDVGIKDEKGQTKFNPPSLLGVSQRDRLLHDGRADSLQDVLLKVKHELTDPLSKQDAADLVYFLESL